MEFDFKYKSLQFKIKIHHLVILALLAIAL